MVKVPDTLHTLSKRLFNRADPERIQSEIRIVIVSLVMLYSHSDFFSASMNDPYAVALCRWGVSFAFVVAIGIAVAVVVGAGPPVGRRIVGIVHDVAAVSTALYLGEASAIALATVYFWVALGNGFRYGIPYLYAGAGLSIVGFALVCASSDYWQQEGTLSLNILIMLAAIPPYVARLLRSLRKAQAQLRYQASVDGLTGLLNRTELVRGIEAALELQHDGHYLLYSDLDYFKELNDAAGHAAGDKLLKDIGRIIASHVRSDDLTARLGGDEFCVFIKNCPTEKVRQIAENIRNSVSGHRIAWGTEYHSVGISIGAAPSSAVTDVESLFRLADAGCYAAKNAGRNQVHIVDPGLSVADTQVVRIGPRSRDAGYADTGPGDGKTRPAMQAE